MEVMWECKNGMQWQYGKLTNMLKTATQHPRIDVHLNMQPQMSYFFIHQTTQ